MATTQNFENFTANQARGYASLATRYAKEFSESARIRETIVSHVETPQEGKYVIRISAGDGLSKDSTNTPDVRAREYGSGIHARRGGAHYIKIRPKNGKKFLAFKWELANENIPKLPDGRVLLKEVNHPGIEADNGGKGYLHPAINKVNADLRKRFGREARKAIALDLRASIRKQNA